MQHREIEVRFLEIDKDALVKRLRELGARERGEEVFKESIFYHDTEGWPCIPTYIELEGTAESQLQKAARELGLDWEQAEFRDARRVIEEVYKLPLTYVKTFMFDKIEYDDSCPEHLRKAYPITGSLFSQPRVPTLPEKQTNIPLENNN